MIKQSLYETPDVSLSVSPVVSLATTALELTRIRTHIERRQSRFVAPQRIERMRKRGRHLLDKHGLHDWDFLIGCDGRDAALLESLDALIDADNAGICYHRKKAIIVQYHLTKDFHLTVLHEIAHALLPDDVEGNHHGVKWQDKAAEIGVSLGEILNYYMSGSAA
jgi:SprT-like family